MLLTAENARNWLRDRVSASLEDALFSIISEEVIPGLPLADQANSIALSNALHGIAFYAQEFYPLPPSTSKLHEAVMRRLQPQMREVEGEV